MKMIKLQQKINFIVLATLLLLSGCSKLDEKPLSSIAPQNFYTSIPQCESALTGAMARLYSEWNDQSYGYAVPLFRRDDQYQGDNTNVPEDYGKTLWQSHWSAILNCNAVLKAIGRGAVKDASQTDLDIVAAQAKFIRSWNYFQLVRLWGGLPLYTEENEDPALNPLARTTIAETYALIIADFTYAADKLPAEWPASKRGRPNKAAANGLMAKAYLTMATNPLNAPENYAKAMEAAKKVMTDNIHDLTPIVSDVFKRENKYSPEMIWSLIANSADPTSSPQIWNTNEGWGDGAAEPRLDSIWPSQPRKTAYFRTVNDAGENYYQWGGTNAPYCTKFLQPYVTQSEWDSYQSYANMPVLRFADVLLIYAEASNMASAGANAPQDACDAINRVIDRANGGAINPDPRASRATTAWSKAEFDKRVIQERNFELCFEWDRWFDLIRKRLLGDPTVFPPYYGYVYKESDNLWPIPTLDLQQNKLFVQNPGY
jgi:starch-binding outer membrane protein, SusD/RagB family